MVMAEVMMCKKPGCGNKIVKRDPESAWYGWCFRHAQEAGLVSKEEVAAFEDKRSAGIREAWKRGEYGKPMSKKKSKILAKAAIGKSAAEIEVEKRNEEKEAQAIIHMILGDKGYNAQEMIDSIKETSGERAVDDIRVKKMVFMQWYLADPKSRHPETSYELCKILSLPLAKWRDWSESDWFISDLQAAMQKNMKLALPFLARVVLAKAVGGDFNALKEFMKMFGKHLPSEGSEDLSEFLEPEVLEEASLIAGPEN